MSDRQAAAPEWDRLRAAVLDADSLVRALASGRRKGGPAPAVQGREVRRVEVRVVDLKAGRHLQVTAYDATQAHTTNHALGDDARAVVDALLAEPFANWHVDTTDATHQLRVTKKGAPLLHTSARTEAVEVSRDHDRAKDRLLAEDDPVLVALGISDAQGRVKPTRQAKYRQVEEECGLACEVGDLLGVHDTHFSGHAPSGRIEDYHGIHLLFAATVGDGEPRVVEVDGTTDEVAWVDRADVESGRVPVLDVVTHALRLA